MAMAERRVIKDGSSSKRKIRIHVGHILVAVFALTLVILHSTARLVRESDFNKKKIHSSHDGDVAGQQTLSEVPPPRKNNVQLHDNESKGIKIASTSVDPSANSFHFVVSSDCTSYQRWETLTQLHSAQNVNQCGRFTWIVSGCLEDGSEQIGKGKGGANSDILTPSLLLSEVERHFPHLTISNHTIATGMGRSASVAHDHNQNGDCSSTNIHPHVHFTPDYSNMAVYGGPFADGKKKRGFLNRKGNVVHGSYGNTYKFNNKPNGLHHWAVDFLAQDDRRDEAVVLIDPDFLFLKKFEFPENTPPVLPGKPAAAKYGLGGQFLDFNLTQICDRAPPPPLTKGVSSESKVCPFGHITNQDVNRYYSAGPPYIIHIQDVLELSKRWLQLVPPTYDVYPLLYAEMFAYSMAAADLDLKHNLIRGLFMGCMIPWPGTNGKGELEALKTSAKTYAGAVEKNASNGNGESDEGAKSCFLPPLNPPPFLHYCARYSFATPYPHVNENSFTPTYHFFAKRRVEDDAVDCKGDNNPLEPFVSTKREKIEGGQKDWNVLAICAAVRAINFAKKKGCNADGG